LPERPCWLVCALYVVCPERRNRDHVSLSLLSDGADLAVLEVHVRPAQRAQLPAARAEHHGQDQAQLGSSPVAVSMSLAACSASGGTTSAHPYKQHKRPRSLTRAFFARREGFESPTARSVRWCSASIWSGPDGSALLRWGGSSGLVVRPRAVARAQDSESCALVRIGPWHRAERPVVRGYSSSAHALHVGPVPDAAPQLHPHRVMLLIFCRCQSVTRPRLWSAWLLGDRVGM
jgi:hypothetical protein